MSLAEYADQGSYHKDVRRIVYCNAYKRLAYKSQIIVKPTRDHFRSRLTHTEEVNQIALSIGRDLNLNLELIEAIARAHDLGHTPFGHAGERALREILTREIEAGFSVKREYRGQTPKAKAFRKKTFHHSLNSARIIVRQPDLEGIAAGVISGVINHSWSPWKKEADDYQAPGSYEAQVVAISDQIASIIHDTEDIIEGQPYTNYDSSRFHSELKHELKKRSKSAYQSIGPDLLNFVKGIPTDASNAKENFVDSITGDIVASTKQRLTDNSVSTADGATACPICLTKDRQEALSSYEFFIRELLQQRVPWFIARDFMAGALISTVFTHFWSAMKSGTPPHQTRLFEDSVRIKAGRAPTGKESGYLEHFYNFYTNHYDRDGETSQLYREYLEQMRSLGIFPWDLLIWQAIEQPLSADHERHLTSLVAVTDFVAGLTDRYCLEIFDDVYKNFIIS